jgi:hypothetical protein
MFVGPVTGLRLEVYQTPLFNPVDVRDRCGMDDPVQQAHVHKGLVAQTLERIAIRTIQPLLPHAP